MRARFLCLLISIGIALEMGCPSALAEPSPVLVLRATPSARFPERGSFLTYTLWIENPSSTPVTFRNPSFLLPEGVTLVSFSGFLTGNPQLSVENGRTRLLWKMTRLLSTGEIRASLLVQVNGEHRGGIFGGEWRIEEQTSSGFLLVVLEEAAPVIFDDPEVALEWQTETAYSPVETTPPSLPLLPSEDSVLIQVRVLCPLGRQCLGINLLQGGQTFPLLSQGEGKFEGTIAPVSLRFPYHWEHNCVQAEILLDGGEQARRLLFCMYRHQPALRVRDTSNQPLASAQVYVYRLPGSFPGEVLGCDISGWETLPPVNEDVRQAALPEDPLINPGRAEPPFFNTGFTAQDGTFSLQLERGCYFVRVVKNDCEEWVSPLYGAPPAWQDLPVPLSCTKRVYLPFIQR